MSVEVVAPSVVSSVTWNSGNLVDGAEVATFTVSPPSIAVKCKYQVGLTVGVCHAKGPTGIEATGVRMLLGFLCEEVRAVIDRVGKVV
jgi:hypothetical protein